MLNAVMLTVVMLTVVMLTVVMLTVVMLTVVMLTVVAPFVHGLLNPVSDLYKVASRFALTSAGIVGVEVADDRLCRN